MSWQCLRRCCAIIPSGLLLLSLAACSPDYDRFAAQRVAYAQQNQGEIEIAAIRSSDNEGFIEGVTQAVNEINQSAEKLLGRDLKLHIEPEGDSFEDSRSAINRIVSNPRITAVLGHRKSAVAVPVSAIYERSQLVFMPPASTDTKLTGHNFQYVFRMFPSNTVMAAQLTSAAKTLGYKKIVLLYSRDDLSRELAFLFEDSAVKLGIELVHRSSFFEDDEAYQNIIAQFGGKSFDAVFIASSAKPAGRMVKQLREMGIGQPVMGRHSLNSPAYIKEAGAAAQNTIAPNVFPHEHQNAQVLEFVRHYQSLYDNPPNYNAAQGYDSVMLLASAIRRAGSTMPSQLSTTLHYIPATIGVTGLHAFDGTGDLLGKKYKFEVWREGEWHLLPALHIPYLLERFEAGLTEKYGSSHNVTPFSSVFSQRMHEDDHNIYLLDLAQEILQFKHLGVIYENTVDGRKAANYDMLKTLTERKKIDLAECQIALSVLNAQETEQALTACYGKLSLQSDALFIPTYRGVNPDLIQRLNRSLVFYKIPSISLDTRNTDTSITLVLGKRSDINNQTIPVYSGLLNNIKVHEFSERMKGLPELSVNLTNLQNYGLHDQPVLDLSPDSFLHSHDMFLQIGSKP